MSGLIDKLFGVDPWTVYTVVTLLVFAEDAIFIGFVLPGEAAAVIGGVIASQGEVNIVVMVALVVAAAIVGDSVGYEIGRHFGPRILDIRILAKHQDQIRKAQDFLRRRGGPAVFFGRFIAFFRAMMPALAGISRMPYAKFIAFNAVGGIVWGSAFVLLGYYGSGSYQRLESVIGEGSAIVVAAVAVLLLVIWRVRRRRSG